MMFRPHIVQPVLTILLFFIALFVYTKLAGPISFNLNAQSTNFQVTGEGKASIKPDSATVHAGVSVTGASSTVVQEQMNTKINQVITAVKALGIDAADIQTANYSVNPNYDYTSEPQRISGYIANTNLTIKVKDITKVNSVIDAATKAGATNVNNSGFDVADDSSARDEARKMAIADAKKKAQAIASQVGFRLGNITNYSESGPSGQPRPYLMATDKAVGGNVATQVEPGTNEVTVSVTLSYEVR